jgi:hypothetical protein
MFEAKPLSPAPYAPSESRDSAGSLHPVRWPDLVAKLDAARDLRASLLAHPEEGEASFDPHCAQHIAALCEGKRGINLDDLVDGKATGGNGSGIDERAAGGDPRE